MVSTRNQTLKRTRSPAERPVNVPSTAAKPPSKRQCRGLDCTRPCTKPQRCYLEELPAELLQQIFFTALNGNLLKASPQVAIKLSGSDAIRQAAFFLCFYSPDIGKIRDHFGFKGILSEICTPVPFWELRSMTHAVLTSSWCKWSWVKNFLYDLLADAVYRFKQDYTSKVDDRTTYALHSICQHRNEKISTLAIREMHGKGPGGGSVGIGTNLFDISINSYPDKCEDDVIDFLGDTDTWTDFDIFRLRCNAFGSKQLNAGLLEDRYLDDTPFREIVGHALDIGDPEPTEQSMDLWERHENQMMHAAKFGNEKELRDLVQVDYFFYPEDVPYRISPRLFRAAAKADVGDSEIDWKGRNLHVLFDVDPFSLPRGDRAFKRWASFAAYRCRSHEEEMRYLNRQLVTWPIDSSLLDSLKKKALQRRMRQMEYWHDRDVAILRFIRHGVLDFRPDLLSPRLAGQALGPVTESDLSVKSTFDTGREANEIAPNNSPSTNGSEDDNESQNGSWILDEREAEYPSDVEGESETDPNAESEEPDTGVIDESDDELESLYDYHERIGRHEIYHFGDPEAEREEFSDDELDLESEEDYQSRVQQHEAQKQADDWIYVTDWGAYEASKRPEEEMTLFNRKEWYEWFQSP